MLWGGNQVAIKVGLEGMPPLAMAAARFIIERARAEDERPLYILAMGALTNIASALLMAPDIIESEVIVDPSAETPPPIKPIRTRL